MSKRMFMETTKIPARRTAAQISEALADAGANAVLMEYANGDIEAVSFRLNINGQEVPFRLPVRVAAVVAILAKRRGLSMTGAGPKMRAQGARIAWRQILRWVQAQLALVQTNMVSAEEVFMPYMQIAGDSQGRTLYEVANEKGFGKYLPLPTDGRKRAQGPARTEP